MDTLAISKNLQAAGMETRQAEAESIDTQRGDRVTKDYLNSRLEALEARLVALANSLFNRLLIAIIAASGVIIAATRFLSE